MNLHDKTVGIDLNNNSDYDFKHQSMTLDFDPFWMFQMIGDPLLLIGDPKKVSLVTKGSLMKFFVVTNQEKRGHPSF